MTCQGPQSVTPKSLPKGPSLANQSLLRRFITSSQNRGTTREMKTRENAVNARLAATALYHAIGLTTVFAVTLTSIATVIAMSWGHDH